MKTETDTKQIIEEHNRLFELDWDMVRSTENFELVPKKYSFGTRNTYVPKNPGCNESLQNSRGISIEQRKLNDVSSLEGHILKTQDSISVLSDADKLRIEELDNIILDKGLEAHKKRFCEIGFRMPKLLKRYLAHGYSSATGYDISNYNVLVGKYLGYDCHVLDLNEHSHSISISENEKYDVLVCYHVLEHTFDPQRSLEKILSLIKPGGILHIEVPIEPGMPRLRYGHLIAMENGDLRKILENSSMLIVHSSNKSHTAGVPIERIAAIKG
jgi:2-polyprenyl-3-methyl-5-hydroxy-6-metoxy-1,4-benzoquinol methylase